MCLNYSTQVLICQALFLIFFWGRWGIRTPTLTFSPHLGDTVTCSPVFAGGATRTHIIPLPTQPKTPATDGRTRLERVEWHNGGLSATDAHHLRFVPLLYHALRGLSRGFLLFVRALPARLPPLFRCVLSPLNTLIVSQFGRFVKSYIFPRRYLTRTSSKESGRESPSPSWLDAIAPTFRTFFHSHLFCTLIVSQLG